MNAIPNANIASLTWKIDNFRTLSKQSIKSPSFSSLSNEIFSFHLILYHNAKFCYSSDISKSQIAIFLMMENATLPKPLLKYRVSLVNAKGEKCHTILKQNNSVGPSAVLAENRCSTYRRDFVLNPENGILSENGTLIVHCEVVIVDEEKSHDIECCDSLTRDYGSLLKNCKLSDVVLVVGGHELMAHKAILASRSVVFAAMFEHDCEEKRTNRVDITDGDKEVFDDLLRFIYTGKVESLDQNASDLLIAADKYQLDQLKSICSRHLVTHLTPESVAPTLVLADMHQLTELKEKCIEYITEQTDGIKLADWKKICESNLELAHSLFQRSMKK